MEHLYVMEILMTHRLCHGDEGICNASSTMKSVD